MRRHFAGPGDHFTGCGVISQDAASFHRMRRHIGAISQDVAISQDAASFHDARHFTGCGTISHDVAISQDAASFHDAASFNRMLDDAAYRMGFHRMHGKSAKPEDASLERGIGRNNRMRALHGKSAKPQDAA